MAGPFDFEFSEAEFRETLRKIEEGTKELADKLFPELRPKLDEFFKWIRAVTPQWVIDAAYKLVNWAIEMLEDFLNQMVALIEGLLVPIDAGARAYNWHGEINWFETRAANLRSGMQKVGLTWKGEGATAFATFGENQVKKLDEAKALAEAMRNGYVAMCIGGTALYVGLAAIIAKAITASAAAVASTPVTGPGGPAAAGGAAGLGAVEVVALIAAATGLLEPCIQIVTSVSDKANTLTTSWPDPETSRYNDGSMSDGDGSDWSTER